MTLTANSIEKIVKNTIYRGYRVFKNKKYYFLDPIVSEKKNVEKYKKTKRRIEIEKRKRNLKKHYYYFEKFLKEDFNLTTAKKKLASGKIKEYKYYLHKKNKKLKINEKEIIKKIKEKMNAESSLKNKNLNNYFQRIVKLYVQGIIGEDEVIQYKKEIKKNLEHFNLIDKLKNLCITETGEFFIELKN